MAASASSEDAQPWGYVVYRTFYTPESKAVWDSVTAKLENYANTCSPPKGGPGNPEWAATPRLFYMNDAALYNGFSLSQVRDDFTTHCSDSVDLFNEGAYEVFSRGAHDSICLVIDEEVIHSIINDAPDDVLEAKRLFKRPTLTPKHPIPYVKAVDRNYEPPKPNPPGVGRPGVERPYPGWMKAGILWLGNLYPHDEMELESPDWDPDLGDESYPVYQGAMTIHY
ncbi:hypothetical protein FQN49_006417 [Arthroderma sp. PD_2]|nr:hypothetical protein FQN49_006417 [Arthroderma sp. PD_2]